MTDRIYAELTDIRHDIADLKQMVATLTDILQPEKTLTNYITDGMQEEFTEKNHVRHGKHTINHNGKPLIICNWSEGVLHGSYEEYTETTKYIGIYDKGVPIGVWRRLDLETYNCISTDDFYKGTWDYVHTKYYADGSKKVISYYNHSINDAIIRYDKINRITYQTEMVNGKKNGIYIQYYSDGSKSIIGTYKEGMMDGEWKYYRSSTPHILQMIKTYSNDKETGVCQTFDIEGKLNTEVD